MRTPWGWTVRNSDGRFSVRQEVRTQLKRDSKGTWVVVVDIIFVPRGSGNRNHARRLGEEFRSNAKLGPHVLKVVVGASKVRVYMRPSMDLMKVIAQWPTPVEDVPGQMLLP